MLSHRLVHAVLRDDRFGIPPGITLLLNGVDSGPVWDKVTSSLLCMGGDQHRRLRSLVSKAFTPRATARLSDTIDEVLNELIDKVAAKGECEFVADVARPYPVPIICSLIGAPREDWAKFSLWTDVIFRAFSYSYRTENDEQSVMRAWTELDDYIDDMVASRRHSLTDDLLSGLIRAEDHGDQLNDEELRMLVGGLLMAGTDTTRNQVAASAHILCQHPEQWALLREKPELAMNAVEETMRHRPIASSLLRTALDDVELTATSSRRTPSSSSTPSPPTAIPTKSTKTRIGSTSHETSAPLCCHSEPEFTTALAATSPGSNWRPLYAF